MTKRKRIYGKAVFEPIGHVESIIDPEHRYNPKEVTAKIIIKPELEEALQGIEEFSHIIVIFWTHKFSDTPYPLKVHPKRSPDLPLRGVLATRSPIRPNCVGLSTVKLENRKNNILEVKGLDAYNETPVLDIKPYIKALDCIPDAKEPAFIEERRS
nr:tRNA (N6-threonylcarbamoyladenosine(37)-N6)-methyltransferase TrmO [Candidatus Sigynarchaeota archaeon]